MAFEKTGDDDIDYADDDDNGKPLENQIKKRVCVCACYIKIVHLLNKHKA